MTVSGFKERIRMSFDKQSAMRLIRATIERVEEGRTEIHLPHWPIFSR